MNRKTRNQEQLHLKPSQPDEAIDESRLTRKRMLSAMQTLEAALAAAAPGREKDWRARVLMALDVLEGAMDKQCAELEHEQGLLSEILREAPRFKNRVSEVRRQYADLLRQINGLCDQFTVNSDDGPEVADMRQRVGWLLAAIRHFQARISDLVYEAFGVEIGVVD